ncbi:uncharacterized protein [Ptychodera flava]|uniref:uncharacterized protein isoform X1 n=1 Tax=Ptychodera flava TaxID=63121 RepID=UPI00396A9217
MSRKLSVSQLCFTILTLLSLCALECSALTDEELEALDEFVDAAMTCKNVPGLTLAMVKDGQTVVAKGYGVSDMDKGTPVTEHTLFNIASCSKSFTASLMAKILSKHQDISWSTPYNEYISDIAINHGDDYRNTQTTMYDLLSHRVCMADDVLYLLMGGFVNVDRSDYVRHRQYLDEICPFRSKYSYLNTMYAVAGEIAEELEGDTFEDLIREHIYDPLGMTSSGFVNLDWDDENYSESYVWMPDQYWHHFNKSTYVMTHAQVAAGGIMSNAVDMAKYMNFILSGGKDESGEQVVDESYLRETLRPQTAKHNPYIQSRPTFPVDESSYSYALGWDNYMYRGYVKNFHSGNFPAFGSRLAVYPEVNVGVFIGANGPYDGNDHAAMQRIEAFATDLLLGEEPWLNTTTACTFPEPRQPSSDGVFAPFTSKRDKRNGENEKKVNEIKIHNVHTARPLDDYVGVYGHKALGNCSIWHEDASKNLRYRYGEYGLGELIPSLQADVFVITMVGPMTWFLEIYTGEIPLVARFGSSKGDTIDELVLPYAPVMPMHVFRRGELMHDPPTPKPTVPLVEDCASVAGQSPLIYVLLAIISIVCTTR